VAIPVSARSRIRSFRRELGDLARIAASTRDWSVAESWSEIGKPVFLEELDQQPCATAFAATWHVDSPHSGQCRTPFEERGRFARRIARTVAVQLSLVIEPGRREAQASSKTSWHRARRRARCRDVITLPEKATRLPLKNTGAGGDVDVG